MSTVALFCGSRKWTDREAIRRDIQALPAGSVVVEGGAGGADAIAREEASIAGLHCATVRAQWATYGKGAGPLRNAAMLKLGVTCVYAYPLGGPGTADMVRQAVMARVPVFVRGETEATNV